MVINHNAQQFPILYKDKTEANQTKEKFLFDRILCDVPCSSDAAIRKIPGKWEKWSPMDSFGLHPLQIRILVRGLTILKVCLKYT